MRVLILNYEYPPLGGGAANAMFHIVREFASRGFPAVDVVTLSVPSPGPSTSSPQPASAAATNKGISEIAGCLMPTSFEAYLS